MNTLIVLSALGIITLFAEIFRFRKALFPIILIGLAGAFAVTAMEFTSNPQSIFGMMVFDKYAVTFSCALIVIGFLWFMMARNYFLQETSVTDHFALILFSLVGAVVMVSYSNLTMLFLGIEILSVSVYVLAASDKASVLSNESGFKYFLMGSFASGFLLFGITLIYGVTGSFDLVQIQQQVLAHPHSGMLLVGVILILMGVAFKCSLAPFHFWAPDVYDGAPTTVTTYMASVVKTAAFGAFFRLFSMCFSSLTHDWAPILWWIVVLTLFIGNVSALRQLSVKRMLAYSSIAHAGYIAIAIVSMTNTSAQAILYYTLTYSISTITSFTVLYIVSRNTGRDDFGAFEGMAKNNPFLAFVMTVAMLSLAGIPPTAGFFGKYYIFLTAINSHNSSLVIAAVLAALIGVYYYFRVIISMYFKPEKSDIPASIGSLHQIVLFITTMLTLLLGIFPDWILNWLM
ncbi:MAG TPA: NADH-quinone oxidoreductase subunit N [Bacteroidia bacterium]|nr:NADH-quinone oxidoreductase subunit N [Bacteroidia bacterium]